MMLISLNQGKDHIRVERDNTANDSDITLKIHAASAAVLNYLKSAADDFLDSNGDIEFDSNDDPVGVPFEVYAATCMLLEDFIKNRGGSDTGLYEQGYLPKPVTAILYTLRDPACV